MNDWKVKPRLRLDYFEENGLIFKAINDVSYTTEMLQKPITWWDWSNRIKYTWNRNCCKEILNLKK